MARKSSLFDDLVELPWWVSLVMGGVAYATLRYWLPMIHTENIVLQAIGNVAPQMASYIGLLFVLISALAFLNSWRKRRLLNSRSDLESIRQLSWSQFETLIGEFFRRKGYHVIENTQLGADGGVDVTLRRDGETTLVQCKNWRANKVGVPTVRELLGSVTALGADKGIVVCSGRFTADAKKFAATTAIDLIDGEALLAYIKTEQKITTVETQTASCPRCQSPMVERKATKGKNPGSRFLGCSTYPKCRMTRPI